MYQASIVDNAASRYRRRRRRRRSEFSELCVDVDADADANAKVEVKQASRVELSRVESTLPGSFFLVELLSVAANVPHSTLPTLFLFSGWLAWPRIGTAVSQWASRQEIGWVQMHVPRAPESAASAKLQQPASAS